MKTVKLSTSVVLIMACALTLHAQKFKLPGASAVTKKAPAVTSQLSKPTLPPQVTTSATRSGMLYGTFFPIPSFVTNWLKKWKTPALESPVTAPTAVPAQTTEQLIEDLNNATLQRHQAQVSMQQRLDAELDEIEDELLAQDLESDLQNAIHEQHRAQANLSTRLDAELDQAEADLLAGKIPLETAVERTVAEQVMQQEQKAAPRYKFLDGIDALNEYASGWAYEIYSKGYGDDIVNHVRRAFKQTQQIIFETDAQGKWINPKHRTYQLYSDWFYKVLGSKVDDPNRLINTVRHAELFGPVLALMDLQSFVAFYGRLPSLNADGFEHYVAYVVEKYNVSMHTVAPQQTPQIQAKPRTTVAQKTPQEWLEQIKPFVLEHKRWPSSHAQGEKQLYSAAYTLLRYHPNDPASIELKQLKDQYVREYAPRQTPQQWLEIIEPWVLEHKHWPSPIVESEAPLYEAAKHILTRQADTPVAKRLQALRDEYSAKPKPRSKATSPEKRPNLPTSQNSQRFDTFKLWVQEHQRWPSSNDKAEKAMYYWAYGLMREKPNDPISIELEGLKKQYLQERTPRKTAQEWLDIIEPWVLEHKRWPSTRVEEEKQMYQGARDVIKQDPSAPVSLRLKALKEQYSTNNEPYKTPQQWLEVVESWVSEHGRWPSPTVEEEKAIYEGAKHTIARWPDDPAGIRLKELKEKYSSPTPIPTSPQVTIQQAVLEDALDNAITRRVAKAQQLANLSTFERWGFLTTQEVLNEYAPNWKSTALHVKNYGSLIINRMEQIFRQTDQDLFVTDSQGKWAKPVTAQKGLYSKRFRTNLIRAHISGAYIDEWCSLFERALIQLDVQSFVVFNGRMPSLEAADGAERALAKQAQELNIKLAPLPEEALNKVEPVPQTPAPTQPRVQTVPTPQKPSNQPVVSRRTPQEWLEIIESWVGEHKRWPSYSIEEERPMYMGAQNIIRQDSSTPVSLRLKALKEQYAERQIADSKSPQKWLEIIEPWVLEHKRWPSHSIEEEKQMNKGAQNAILKNSNDPASIRLKELQEQYRTRGRSPQQWLEIIEPWVLEHQRWPLGNVEEEKALYMNSYWAMRNHPDDPASVRMKELKEKYSSATTRAPQQWLEIIEPWVLEHQRWPSRNIEEEKDMFNGANYAIYNHPNNPASIRLKELRKQYGTTREKGRSPQEWLEVIEPWVIEHGRWPSNHPDERKMNKGAWSAIQNNPTDPASIRLKELQEQYK